MIGAQEVLESFTESNLEMHVELSMGTNHVVKESQPILFQLESGGTLGVKNVLWVPELKRSMILVSVIEKNGMIWP
jgi:hypothetical protein